MRDYILLSNDIFKDNQLFVYAMGKYLHVGMYSTEINLKHPVRLSANGIAETSQRVALAIDSLDLIVMLFGCFDLSQAQKLQQQTSGVFLSKVCALTNN